MDTTARSHPAGDLRVSDADRDAALAELSEHFQTGRLTSDELDERIGRAIRARTGQDLADLMADLPAVRQPAGAAASTGTGLARRRTLTTAVIIAVTAIVTAAVVAASLVHEHGHGFVLPGWVILAGYLTWRRLTPRRPARSGGRRSRLD